MKISGNTILITGGGSGIGAAYAQRLAELGNTIIIAGRREPELANVAAEHANIHSMALDVTAVETIATFCGKLLTNFPALNVIVNNAGIMRTEDITKLRDLRDAEQTITTNLLAPIRLINYLIDHLKEQQHAAILNISSGLAFVPLLTAATYSATKAAVHSYTVSLRELLKGQVEVIEIVPPGVQTDLTPGQSVREGYLPLKDFIDESMALLQAGGQSEILVERVKLLRDAERHGRFDGAVQAINPRK